MPDVRLRAWQRWQAAAGDWRGWAMCPSLTMPTRLTFTNTAPAGEPLEVGALASAALAGAPTALVVDLDPILGVRIAAELNHRRLASVVLILPRWPHPDAVLPAEKLVSTLVEGSSRVGRSESAAHVIFVLDGERSTSIRRSPSDPRIDNRYNLAVGDLPTLRQLRGAGIERVVKVSPTSPA